MKPILDLKKDEIDLPESEPSLQLPRSGTLVGLNPYMRQASASELEVPSVVIEEQPPLMTQMVLPSIYEDESSSRQNRRIDTVLLERARQWQFKLFFRWYDMWVGAYWDQEKRHLYLCPLPMFGLRVSVPFGLRWRTLRALRSHPFALALVLSSLMLLVGVVLGLEIRSQPVVELRPLVMKPSTVASAPPATLSERLLIPPPEPVPVSTPSELPNALPPLSSARALPARSSYKPMPSAYEPGDPIPRTRD